MASVFEVVKQSGRIALDELAFRSTGSPGEVTQSVRELRDRGLVRVTGTLPETPEDPAISEDTIVEITERGFGQVR